MSPGFDPPSSVSGMKVLNKEAFQKSIIIPAIQIDPMHCSNMRKGFSRILLKQARIKDVLADPQNKGKRILLLQLHIEGVDDFTEKEREIMEKANGVFINHKFVCTYDNYSADQVLSAVMPSGTEVTTAFETIGHIAHLNLRDHQLEFKEMIGQVILDKNANIKTVVNKINTIEETFRFFHMELIAGEDRMFASVKQHDCKFEFDFSKVYWNSRLQTEHKRIIDLLKPGDVVCDVFAGVGPFAVPAAKKGCKVHANDLNPESYKALGHNLKLNKVENNSVAYNMDGREFLKKFFKFDYEDEETKCSTNGVGADNVMHVDHVLMNLPALAVEFLDVFRGKCNSHQVTGMNPKVTNIHCYCFSKAEDPFKDARNKVEEVICAEIPDSKVHYVRNVAPKKAMMCVSFTLMFLSNGKVCCEELLDNHIKDNERRGVKRPAEDL